jgi:hypothetical protein
VNTLNCAAGGEHFVSFEDHVVFAAVQRNAQFGQGATDLAVACQGLGFVIMVGVDGLHMELPGKTWQLLGGEAVPNEQTALGLPGAQRLVQGHQAVADELDAPVCARQAIENVAVEDEGAPDLA